MGFEKVIYVSGKPGLYRIVNKTSFGLVAESLVDGRRVPVYAHQRVSHLTDIAIFTQGEDNLPLKEALLRLADKTNGAAFDVSTLKTEDDFRKAFGEIIPEFDRQRVYASDIKKFFNWYNILREKNLLPEKESHVTPEETSDEASKVREAEKPVVKEKKEKSSKAAASASLKTSAASSKSKGGAPVNTPRKAG
jgi:hypothetical protein